MEFLWFDLDFGILNDVSDRLLETVTCPNEIEWKWKLEWFEIKLNELVSRAIWDKCLEFNDCAWKINSMSVSSCVKLKIIWKT